MFSPILCASSTAGYVPYCFVGVQAIPGRIGYVNFHGAAGLLGTSKSTGQSGTQVVGHWANFQ